MRRGLCASALLAMATVSIAHAEMTPKEQAIAETVEVEESHIGAAVMASARVRLAIHEALHERDAEVKTLQDQIAKFTEQAKACHPPEIEQK